MTLASLEGRLDGEEPEGRAMGARGVKDSQPHDSKMSFSRRNGMMRTLLDYLTLGVLMKELQERGVEALAFSLKTPS